MDIFSPLHLLVILVLVVLIFGTKKISSLGSDLGKAVKGFKQAMHEDDTADGGKKAAATEKLQADPAPAASASTKQEQPSSTESK